MALNDAELKTHITADTSNFKRGVSDVKKEIAGLSQTVTNLGSLFKSVFSVTLFFQAANAVYSIGQSFADLYDKSKNIGVGFETLQRLAFIADESGTSVDNLTNSMFKLQKTIGDALGGKKQSIDALARLGLSAQELERLAPEDQLAEVAQKLRELGQGSTQTSIAVELFGKSAKNNMQIFNNDLDEAIRKSKELKGILTTEEGQILDNLYDWIAGQGRSYAAGIGMAIASQVKLFRGDYTHKNASNDMLVSRGLGGVGYHSRAGVGAIGFTSLRSATGAAGSMNMSGGLDGIGTQIMGLSTGLDKFATSVEQAGKALKDNFVSAGKDILDAYNKKINTIDDLLGNNDNSYLSSAASGSSNLKQVKSDEFNSAVRDVLEYAKNPNAKQSEIKRRLNDLRNQSAADFADQGFSWTDRQTYSQTGTNSGQMKAIDQLAALLLDKEKQAVQVNVKIEADAEGVFRAVVTNKQFDSTAAAITKAVLAKEARGVSR